MNRRAIASTAACALVLAASGCGLGRDGDEIRAAGPNPNDKRAVALRCLTSEKGVRADLAGTKSIQVQGPNAPRIEFFVSSGEAEALQFQGEAQGAEQVGAALLFVNGGDDELLLKIEECLAKQ